MLDGVREEAFDPIEGWSGTAQIFETGTPGPEPEDSQKVSQEEQATPTAPNWLSDAPPAEPSPPRPLAPSRPEEPDPPVRSPLEPGDSLRFQRGRLVHRLLQTLPDLPESQRLDAARRFLALPAHGLEDAQQAALTEEVFGVLNHSEFAPLFGPGSRAEVPLAGLLNRSNGESVAMVAVAGQVDRLLITKTEILVVDYKTLRPAPSDPEKAPRAYLSQMAGYREILREIFPDRPIRCALVFTETPLLVALPDKIMDAYA